MSVLAPLPLQHPSAALDLIFARRSVRAYAPDPLAPDTVRGLLAAAVRAPTAMHLEPWAFLIVQDRHRLRRISDLAKALSVRDAPPDSRLAREMADPAFNVFYDAGTLIVVCTTSTSPFAEADCWLAAGNLMLAASATGLGSCCIGLATGALNAPDVKAELGVAAPVRAIAPIIVGVPRGTPPAPADRKAPNILAWL